MRDRKKGRSFAVRACPTPLRLRPVKTVSASETWDPHYISCDGFPDGFHEAGCWGKAVCVNGQPQVTKCPAGQMYDVTSDTCVSISQHLSTTDCNTPVDCGKEVDGRHADVGDGCRSYYICLQGAFMGRMYCPPPLGLNCTGKDDGNYEIGCRVYTVCSGGKSTVVECDPGSVYSTSAGKCDAPANVPPPCGEMKDCSNMADGHYPDLDNNCRSYYTCVEGRFVGHNFCPASLVFNEKNGSCDWPDYVSPPCGTASPWK
ncbi:hypothetical protein BaRGS_00033276 [Batillaria attramentaria]|uniref:Chitin-binding type-2 domain-containing protein n=1 Tax=Batillaria attramentaria TaxID=370345 RepID=A0ABD0JLW5_9CAEN